MLISLVRRPEELLGSYGTIPEVPLCSDSRAEILVFEFDFFDGEEERGDRFERDFLVPMNDLCGTLLGYGDVDYVDAEHCKRLLPWLAEKLGAPGLTSEEREFCERLRDFADEAVALGTGVVVEF